MILEIYRQLPENLLHHRSISIEVKYFFTHQLLVTSYYSSQILVTSSQLLATKYWSLATNFFCFCFCFFFSIWVFFHEHSQFTRHQGKGEVISLTPLYHFHPLYRHLEVSRAIAAESSPLHVARSWTRTENPWFSSASCWVTSQQLD